MKKDQLKKRKLRNLCKVPNRETYPGRDLMQILRETAVGETPSDMIMGGEPNMYTRREEGVRPEFNIRTDKNDLALEAIQWAREKRDAEQAKLKGDQETTEAQTE